MKQKHTLAQKAVIRAAEKLDRAIDQSPTYYLRDLIDDQLGGDYLNDLFDAAANMRAEFIDLSKIKFKGRARRIRSRAMKGAK